MPQVDVEWPSEDEDFDATIEKGSTKTAKADVTNTAKDEVQQVDEASAEPKASPEPEAPAEPETPQEPEAPEAPAEPEAQPVEAVPAPVTPAAVVAAKPPKAPKSPKSPQKRKAMLRLVAEAVLVLAVIGLGLWTWTLYSDNKDLKTQFASLNANPQVAVQKQTDTLISDVGKLMTLPTGETPTIANVTDASQAKKQSAFFNNAQNGDKVLMYVKAGEAILYRPSTGKIILVAPLTFNNSTSTSSTTTPTTSTTTKK